MGNTNSGNNEVADNFSKSSFWVFLFKKVIFNYLTNEW